MPKADVTFLKQDCVFCPRFAWGGVFTHAKEEKDHYHGHIRNRSVVEAEGVHCCTCKIVYTGKANSDCGGGSLLPNFFIRRAIGKLRACWAGEARLGLISVQNILLGDGSESSFDRLNLDLASKAKLAFPHGNSKGEEHVFNVVGREANTAVILWVEATVRCPLAPVAVPFGAVHCCSSNCLPCNVSKTLDFSQIGTIASCQVCCLGNGKAISNDETKSLSDKFGPLLETVHAPWRGKRQCRP